MSRYVPIEYRKTIKKPNQKVPNNPQPTKRQSAKDLAIERSVKRQALINRFCTNYHIDANSELIKYIKKIFNNPATKNVSIQEYKRELEVIGGLIKSKALSLDTITSIVISNANRGYFQLMYDNQVQETDNRSKNNFVEYQNDDTVTTAPLSSFDKYRYCLDNPNDDNELKEFVYNSFGITIK